MNCLLNCLTTDKLKVEGWHSGALKHALACLLARLLACLALLADKLKPTFAAFFSESLDELEGATQLEGLRQATARAQRQALGVGRMAPAGGARSTSRELRCE